VREGCGPAFAHSSGRQEFRRSLICLRRRLCAEIGTSSNSSSELLQSAYRSTQIPLGRLFVFLTEELGVEDSSIFQKAFQNLRSLRGKKLNWHPIVLLADLLFVFGESSFSLAQNTEIDIPRFDAAASGTRCKWLRPNRH